MRDRGIQWTSVDGNFAGESCIPTPGPAQLHRSRLAHDGDGRRQIPPRVQRANGGERQVGGDPGHQGTQCSGGVGKLLPVIGQTRAAIAAAGAVTMPRQLLAQADYCSQENLAAPGGQEMQILLTLSCSTTDISALLTRISKPR